MPSLKILIKKAFIIVFLALPLSACITGAYNLKEGICAFKDQNYRQAFIRLMPEAQKGQPDAQYAVGYMYYYGQGVTEDRKKARCWIKKAALAGQPDAKKALAILGR